MSIRATRSIIKNHALINGCRNMIGMYAIDNDTRSILSKN